MEIRLDGKAALVTGAGQGIGQGIAEALALAGADVAINYRTNAAGAAETARRVQEAGASGHRRPGRRRRRGPGRGHVSLPRRGVCPARYPGLPTPGTARCRSRCTKRPGTSGIACCGPISAAPSSAAGKRRDGCWPVARPGVSSTSPPCTRKPAMSPTMVPTASPKVASAT